MHRILHIIPTLDRAGAEKQLVLLTTHLPRDEFDIHVCALTRGGPWQSVLESEGIPVTVVGKRWKFDPAALWRLKTTVQTLSPDLVQTWIFAANSYGRVAARWAGVPHLIASERCADHCKVWHELVIDRLLARRTDRIIVNSQGVKDFYVAKGIPAEKTSVIANAAPDVAVKAVDRQAWRAELGLPPSAKVIVTVGRLWPQKRMKDLIWALELLYGARNDVYLQIIGDGPRRRYLERFRDRTSARDRVTFLGHRDNVPDYLYAADCFWLGSGYEGQSNALMEAMQAGLPVVVTDIPGNRDLVEHGKSGMLVRVGDSAAFAQHTHQILNDESMAQKLGSAARERIEQEFSVEVMVARYVQEYRSILNAT